MSTCKFNIFQENPILIWVKSLTFARIRHHRCKMQKNFDIYVDMGLIYVNMRDKLRDKLHFDEKILQVNIFNLHET